jgi:hypothetical protein
MSHDTSTETTETLLNALEEAGTEEERRMYLRAIIRRLEVDSLKTVSVLAKLAAFLAIAALLTGCGGASEPVTGQDESSETGAYTCSSPEDPTSCPGFWAELFTNCPGNSQCLAAPVETARLCCTPSEACTVACSLVTSDAGTILAVPDHDGGGGSCCSTL